MKTLPPNQMTGLQALRCMEAGTLTPESLARSCLERIHERNPEVQAFTAFDTGLATQAARSLGGFDSARPLYGIPFAVKDVIDTADYETSYGSVIYRGHRPHIDAACVAAAREHGAVLMGKVTTCEFATQTPTLTRNPLALDRTPGGSSSGSAAAVADYMVPVAFGTQTTGSTVRPAVYCGVVGYKPTFGFINSAGLKPLSPSQDTITVFTRDVADAAYFTFGLHGAKLMLDADFRPRVGICVSDQWAYARQETIDAIERLGRELARAGIAVRKVQLPAELEQIVEIQGRISAYEARYSLANERLGHHESLSPRLQARLDKESGLEPQEYLELRLRAQLARQRARSLFEEVDVLLYPASEGEAEVGLEETGSPRFGSLCSILHLPAVAFPSSAGPAGMPLGVQVFGPYGKDPGVLLAAQLIARHADYRRDA